MDAAQELSFFHWFIIVNGCIDTALMFFTAIIMVIMMIRQNNSVKAANHVDLDNVWILVPAHSFGTKSDKNKEGSCSGYFIKRPTGPVLSKQNGEQPSCEEQMERELLLVPSESPHVKQEIKIPDCGEEACERDVNREFLMVPSKCIEDKQQMNSRGCLYSGGIIEANRRPVLAQKTIGEPPCEENLDRDLLLVASESIDVENDMKRDCLQSGDKMEESARESTVEISHEETFDNQKEAFVFFNAV